ncbi:MAG: vitamin B12 dependent methionine synthase [Anaerolineae bacterium]|nr:vitamin B12 dependent methionine synthase [Anaerolineae bacterium]
MNSEILTGLPFRVEAEPLLQRLHIRPDSAHEREFRHLLVEAAVIARPKAIYKLAFVEAKEDEAVVLDGMRFVSRVLRVNLDQTSRVFAFVATSGRELEAWAAGQKELLARFWADAINQAVLASAVGYLRDYLAERFAVAQMMVMNPGSLADWPLREQRPLFALLGDVEAAVGVTLTPNLLMQPTKSVSGIFFPSEETFASCQLCPRPHCPNRRAAYDPELFQRKYALAHDQR